MVSITKTLDGFSTEAEALAIIDAAGFHPVFLDIPAETNENHWHDFDSIIFILEGENVLTEAATGRTFSCGPGSRIDFPRGVIHHEHHQGYRALFGVSVDPSMLGGSINLPPETWQGSH
jgi:hypothetical protein